ncbi:hypothetical protein Ddc_24891 [Ditylenchus destructor]|nr:hypothetical protein Ddc_24891 [Ditylenchus destructor]
MERRRRRHGPFQPFGAFPRLGRGDFALAHVAAQHCPQEDQLRQPEPEGADGGDLVERRELRGVVGVAARHAGQAQEVHREEGHVEGNQRRPEMQLAQLFAVHAAGPLGQPVIGAGEQREQRTGHQHVVEVRHHVIRVVHLDVDGRHGQDQPGEAAHGEHEDEADREQHRGFERHGPAPHGGNPVEHLHPGRDGDEHGRVHEVQLPGHRHARREHVVRPHDERQHGDRRGGVHHGGVAKQLLAGEGGHDGRHDAKRRQDHDVDLGVPEEPEHVLVQHRVAAGRGVEEARAEVAVGQHHGDGGGQHRHHGQQQERSDQPGPAEQRHLHQRQAGRAHVQHGHDDVDRAHDGRGAHDVHGEDGQVHARAHLQRQRRVQRPAGGGGAARHEERGGQHDGSNRQQPEAEVVHARERHVRCADLHRDHPVRKAHERRHDGAEHHDQAVHRGELVEQLWAEELQARLEELGAQQQRQRPALEQHDEREDEIHRPDVFVVGGEKPAAPAGRHGVVVVIVTVAVARRHVVYSDAAHDGLLPAECRPRSTEPAGYL